MQLAPVGSRKTARGSRASTGARAAVFRIYLRSDRFRYGGLRRIRARQAPGQTLLSRSHISQLGVDEARARHGMTRLVEAFGRRAVV